VAAVGLLASGCLPAPAQITAVRPPPSTGGVATDAAITMAFDAAMNERSVEDRLRVRDRRGRGIPGCSIRIAALGGRTGCRFSWRGRRTVRLLHPERPLRVSTTYRVSLASGIANRSGARSSLAHSWLFVTEGPPIVNGTDPGPGGVVSQIGALAISFSRAMRGATVARAVTLRPQPKGGAAVVANRSDHARFLVEPRRPLTPGAVYTLVVGRGATDIHGNRLRHRVRVRFTAGAPGSTTGVVFPAGSEAGRLTEVLAAVPPAQPGDPPTVRLLYGSPAGAQILAVWPAADGRRLVVEPAGRRLLRLVDLAAQTVATVPDSAGTVAGAWSRDGSQFAYIAGGALHVYTVATGAVATIADGPGLRGPIAWRPDGSVLAAGWAAGSGPARIVLTSPGLRALTFLPPAGAASAAQEDPVWSPDGSRLAFAVVGASGPRLWWYRPADGAAPTAPIGTVAGTPIAFLDPGTVLVHGVDGGLVRVSAAAGTTQTIVRGAVGAGPIAAAVSVIGRQIAYAFGAGGYAQVWLTGDSGADTVGLTAFGPADPLQAGPPSLIGPLA